MSNKLKKCPFCGGEAKLFQTPLNCKDKRIIYVVACSNCRLQTREIEANQSDDKFAIKSVVKLWNLRYNSNKKKFDSFHNMIMKVKSKKG